MTQSEILNELAGIQALVRDSHLVYTSGRHGSAYFNKDAIYPHCTLTSRLCEDIASRFRADQVEVVLAPAIGGVILSQWVAFHLSRQYGREVLGVYAEKDGAAPDAFVIKRGYDKLLTGRRTLVLEDVLTTGGSVKKVVSVARALGAEIIGVAALCNRGSVTAEELGNVPKLDALVSLDLESWEEKDCPLCARGIAINPALGKGRAKAR